MTVASFTAEELFGWLVANDDFLLLDVRNDVEFGRFKVEGPYPIDMLNVPYMEFIEMEEESVAKVPIGKKVRIVCAKEGSSKYVGEILINQLEEDIQQDQLVLIDLLQHWAETVLDTSFHDLFV